MNGHHARRMRGVSLVELLVGMGLSLSVIAMGLGSTVQNLTEQRNLMARTRLHQDVRATLDLMSRQLRLAGYWGGASAGVWSPNMAPRANPYAQLSLTAGATPSVGFRLSQDAVEDNAVGTNEQSGFRLRQGVVEMQVGTAWQAVTDVNTLVVTELTLTPTIREADLSALCPTPCTAAGCSPRLQTRSLLVRMQAKAADAPQLSHTVQTTIRLRNDLISGSCAAAGSP